MTRCKTRFAQHKAFQLKLKKLQFLYFIGIRDFPGKTEIFGEFFGTFFLRALFGAFWFKNSAFRLLGTTILG